MYLVALVRPSVCVSVQALPFEPFDLFNGMSSTQAQRPAHWCICRRDMSAEYNTGCVQNAYVFILI